MSYLITGTRKFNYIVHEEKLKKESKISRA
jgi:hypothetical protein